MGPERRHARFREALGRQDGRHGAGIVARGELLRDEPLALKAVKAAGTTDADEVVAKMKEIPVNDFYNKDVKIREDGRVMHVMYLWQVKPVSAAKSKYDFCEKLATISPAEAWRPIGGWGVSVGEGLTGRLPSSSPPKQWADSPEAPVKRFRPSPTRHRN